MAENKVTVRGFELDDFFTLSEIYDKLDINFSPKETEGMDAEAVKTLLVNTLLRKFHKAKNEILSLIADLTGLTVDETKKKGIKFIIDVFNDLLKDANFNESLSTVFTQKPTE